jgi:hypothetical protein
LPAGVIEMDSFFGSDVDISHLWGGGSPNDPKCFDLVRDAVAVFEEHRRRHSYQPLGQGLAGRYVGGALIVAQVSSEGVGAGVLHEWADARLDTQ